MLNMSDMWRENKKKIYVHDVQRLFRDSTYYNGKRIPINLKLSCNTRLRHWTEPNRTKKKLTSPNTSMQNISYNKTMAYLWNG